MVTRIHAILMPKWGLTMSEGRISAWYVPEGALVRAGDEVLDVETEKIANVVTAETSGVLRKQLGGAGQTYPCGALIGVIADADVPAVEIDAFVGEHSKNDKSHGDQRSADEAQMVQVGGRTIRILKTGTASDAILFIHGFGADLASWMFVQPTLAARFSTYALDLPGHGLSGKDLSGLDSLEAVADLVREVMDALNLSRAHVVGHSMGAKVAWNLSRRHHDRVTALTLLAPVGFGAEASPEFIEELISASSRREMIAVLKRLFADPSLVTARMVNDVLKFKRLEGVDGALRKYSSLLTMGGDEVEAADITKSDLPVHIICGSQDLVVRPRAANEFGPKVRVTVLDRVGHVPHMEASEATADAIGSRLEP